MDRVALLSMHSSPLAPPGLASAGGMNLYVRHLADGLAERGVEVDIFTRRASRDDPPLVVLASGAHVVHLDVGPARILPKNAIAVHVPAFAEAIRRHAADHRISYDVIHSHYWLSGLAALQLAIDHCSPLVHMFHTLSKVKEFYFGSPDSADTFFRPDGERRIIEGADAIIGATPEELQLMEKLYGRSPTLYAVAPPGVDTTTFRPLDRDACRQELGLGPERVILFVGRVDRIKGLDTLLYSVAACTTAADRGVRLLVVGGSRDAETGEIPRLRRLASTLGIAPDVRFVGSVSPDRLPVYYNAADLCAIPSAYESFGMVATEAMACGTPVVGFRVGGLAGTIQDAQTGFLAEPGIVTDFTAKLRMALESTDLAAMGVHACWSVQRYSWDSVVDRTLDVYERVSVSYPPRRSRLWRGR